MHEFITSCGNCHPLFIKNLSHINTVIYKLHVGVALSCILRRVQSKGRYRAEMCFPDINILCLCKKVKGLPIIRECKRRTAILLLFFCFSFTLRTVGHFPASTGTYWTAAGESAEDLALPAGKRWYRSSAPTMQRCKRREGGLRQICRASLWKQQRHKQRGK